MTAKYFAILTNQGAARLANAAALGTKLNLTQMAVGDANGTLPTPDPAQTKLINQKRIAPLNLLTVDPDNTSQIIAEQIIPENEGGFWIREIGLYDDDGILIAVANCPETYKPQLQEGSGRTQTIRMILIVSSTSSITLKIDPSVVLATRKYVDDKVIEVKTYADDLMKKHVNADNPHTQYPLIANALKEMADAGLVAEVLKNLGLGAGAPPIGIPFFWPLAAMPNTVMDEWSDMVFLKPNGASFSAVEYPKLAKVWTGLVIPDMRGEFLRIWDDGRGVDAGRGLLSWQDSDNKEHLHDDLHSYGGGGAGGTNGTMSGFAKKYCTSADGYKDRPESGWLQASSGLHTMSSGGKEARPRNIAFNFLVRAK
ncbi:phage tail protein [Citrobacter amalonaticus]|uniref:phage tail-collar fiber domain-containing protein n=1 Tax=Citrobacter amalonaticus TaxID=35703 RepID=UPI001C7D59AE|nr:phage tail protein [Citrobacter amalonaticus]QZA37056.1 phage tail protein [Citrobacter amalonaticus]